jgi:hypothetical protein
MGDSNMAFAGIFKREQPASQSEQTEREGLTAHRLNFADHMRLRQMERTLQQTLEELEKVKARLNQLENSLKKCGGQEVASDKIKGQQAVVPTTTPLPVDEIKQLAEMAKRFK